MLLTKLNEWSRPDSKFGSFKPRDVAHLVVLLSEAINMYHLLSLGGVRVEFESQGHREEFHPEGLKVEGDNRSLSPKEVLHPLLEQAVDIVVRQTTPRMLVGEK